MKQRRVRLTVDIPAPVHRKLKEQAAASGRSVRELILDGVRSVVVQVRRSSAERVQFPLIISEGPKVELSNGRIYKSVGFP
jgi:hypothetical protein